MESGQGGNKIRLCLLLLIPQAVVINGIFVRIEPIVGGEDFLSNVVVSTKAIGGRRTHVVVEEVIILRYQVAIHILNLLQSALPVVYITLQLAAGGGDGSKSDQIFPRIVRLSASVFIFPCNVVASPSIRYICPTGQRHI